MACIMDPKTDSNDQVLAWNPETISSTKPFVNICTTPYESLTLFEDMNFVKTWSSIYSSFHKDTRPVNFEIGYPKGSKWFESLKDKWTKYANFYIGGFLEAIYLSNEKNNEATFAQVDAKIIDYDNKSGQQKSLTHASQSTSPKSTNNAFTKKRSQSSTNSPMRLPTTPKHSDPFVMSISQQSSNPVIINDDEDDQPEVLQTDSVIMEDVLDDESNTLNQKKNQHIADDPEFNEFFDYYKKIKSQKSQPIQNLQPENLNTTANLESHNSISGLPITERTRSKKHHLSDLCKDDKLDNQNDDQQEQLNDKPKQTYKKRSLANKEQDESVKTIKQKRTYNRKL